MKTLHVDFVSDVACPWCAVGVHAFERALERLAGDVEVHVRFQPFELNPDMPPEGADTVEYLSNKYGIDEPRIRASQAAIRERGAAVGFIFGERPRVWNTFDAHRLLHWAGLLGKQRELKHALLQAYHGEGRNPGAHGVLLDLVAQLRMPPAEAREILLGDRYAPEVRAEQHFWLRAGIQSVPSLVVNRRHLVEGAQTPEVFEQTLRQLAGAG